VIDCSHCSWEHLEALTPEQKWKTQFCEQLQIDTPFKIGVAPLAMQRKTEST
jgi:hypothetical protein